MPVGHGLETLLADAWPPMPVLILGAQGSGRRTWADHIMSQHGAKLIWRSETPPHEEVRRYEAERAMRERGLTQLPLGKAGAEYLAREHFRVKSRVQRWVSVGLDGASIDAQNALLKVLEELPSGERVILRGQPGMVLSTIRSRCLCLWLRPGTADDEVGLLVSAGIEEDEATELVELRPGRPGSALRLSEVIGARPRAENIIAAAEARDHEAIARSLTEFDPQTRLWVGEWCAAAAAGKAIRSMGLAREAGRGLLMQAEMAAKMTPHPRLAVRAAATLLANRPNV